jgi:hypothetical protein
MWHLFDLSVASFLGGVYFRMGHPRRVIGRKFTFWQAEIDRLSEFLR